MQDHDWNDINIQMNCQKADVARSTFYAHFPTKQDLLDSGFSFGLVEIEHLAQSLRGNDLPTLAWLVDHLSQSQGFRRRLQGSRAGHQTDGHALTFVIGGLFATLDHWLASNCREPQAALIQRLHRQITALT